MGEFVDPKTLYKYRGASRHEKISLQISKV
jgi:hypothetical protein